jgi:hypothetical protein
MTTWAVRYGIEGWLRVREVKIVKLVKEGWKKGLVSVVRRSVKECRN